VENCAEISVPPLSIGSALNNSLPTRLQRRRVLPLPDDKRSLSCRLTVYAPDRTLTAEEASAIRQRIIEGIRTAGYDLRL